MYSFILLSGGVGSRMQNNIPKQYMLLAGKPVIVHILEKIDLISEISEIVLVCADKYQNSIRLMLDQYGIQKRVIFAQAGQTRQLSVFSGLKAAKEDRVIIHEAARPFVKLDDYLELIHSPFETAIFGIDVPFTVIKGRESVTGLLNRSELINVQLPQKFVTKDLLKCHIKALEEKKDFTEDASLLFNYEPDSEIKIIPGRDYNIKITTRMDMLTGEIIYDEIFRRRK